MAAGVLNFLVMLIALLLPIKAFFMRSVSLDEYHKDDKSPPTGFKNVDKSGTDGTVPNSAI